VIIGRDDEGTAQVTVLDDLLERCESSPDVLGVVLSGSQARDGTATVHSDFDVYVIVKAAAVTAGRWRTSRTPELDTIVLSIDEFREPGEDWNRYSFTHARVLLDRLDSEVTRLVAAKGTLGRDEARKLAAEALDGFVNFAYRAAKSRRDGGSTAARLDAAESVPALLTAVFALHGRVRPYNKYLNWELTRYPLGSARWDGLPALLERVLDGDVEAQRYLFAVVEHEARARGHGDVFNAWGDELTLLR
jgi:predicted nucleotidyltransferase